MTEKKAPDASELPEPRSFASYHEFLIAVREARGLRAVDVVNAVNVWWATLSRMESGDIKNPSFRQVIRYARGYGVSLESLAHFFEDGK